MKAIDNPNLKSILMKFFHSSAIPKVAAEIDAHTAAAVKAATQPSQLTDTVMMPRKLTAENGAKAALMGEFSVCLQEDCHHCSECEDGESCIACGGSEVLFRNVNVPWDVIKEIYAKAVQVVGVEHAPSVRELTDEECAALLDDLRTRGSWNSIVRQWHAKLNGENV